MAAPGSGIAAYGVGVCAANLCVSTPNLGDVGGVTEDPGVATNLFGVNSGLLVICYQDVGSRSEALVVSSKGLGVRIQDLGGGSERLALWLGISASVTSIIARIVDFCRSTGYWFYPFRISGVGTLSAKPSFYLEA